MNKLRIGMIGAGAISNSHLPAVAARDDAALESAKTGRRVELAEFDA